MEPLVIEKSGRKWQVIDHGIKSGVAYVAFEGTKTEVKQWIARTLNVAQTSIVGLHEGQRIAVPVSNLFNRLGVVFSREDLLEIVKYAVWQHIVEISIDVPWDELGSGITEPAKLQDLVYSIELVEGK